VGLLGTNFGTGGKNIINLAAECQLAWSLPGAGLNVGVATHTPTGCTRWDFWRAFWSRTEMATSLSTPNLLTLDNEEAKIVIGQNVPFVTGQYTNTGRGGNGSTATPFQTIERKDVGLTLKVKPQISESGTVKLIDLPGRLSSVQASSINSSTGPDHQQAIDRVQCAG